MNSVLSSEIEPTLKQDRSKAEDQMERATMTKSSDPDASADQLPSWPISSRNDRIDPTGAEDVVKAGECHHASPTIKEVITGGHG